MLGFKPRDWILLVQVKSSECVTVKMAQSALTTHTRRHDSQGTHMDLWHLEMSAQKKEIYNSLMTGWHSFSPKWVHSAQLSDLKISRRLCHWAPIVAFGVIALCLTTAMVDSVLWVLALTYNRRKCEFNVDKLACHDPL